MHGPLFDSSTLPAELDDRVRSELRDGERLLWVGQPRPAWFPRESLPVMLFGIPFTAFSIFWMVAATGILFGDTDGKGPTLAFRILFPLFGLPFVLIGLWMVLAPYWHRRKAKRSCYALTDRRAILWEAGSFRSVAVRTYGPDDLSKVYRVEYGNGRGDLVFEEIHRQRRSSKGRRWTSVTRHGFLDVDNVRGVEELLRKVLLPAAGP